MYTLLSACLFSRQFICFPEICPPALYIPFLLLTYKFLRSLCLSIGHSSSRFKSLPRFRAKVTPAFCILQVPTEKILTYGDKRTERQTASRQTPRSINTREAKVGWVSVTKPSLYFYNLRNFKSSAFKFLLLFILSSTFFSSNFKHAFSNSFERNIFLQYSPVSWTLDLWIRDPPILESKLSKLFQKFHVLCSQVAVYLYVKLN